MKIEKFYLFLLACFVAIGAYSQDGQQKMTGDEKSQQQSDAKVKITRSEEHTSELQSHA